MELKSPEQEVVMFVNELENDVRIVWPGLDERNRGIAKCGDERVLECWKLFVLFDAVASDLHPVVAFCLPPLSLEQDRRAQDATEDSDCVDRRGGDQVRQLRFEELLVLPVVDPGLDLDDRRSDVVRRRGRDLDEVSRLGPAWKADVLRIDDPLRGSLEVATRLEQW